MILLQTKIRSGLAGVFAIATFPCVAGAAQLAYRTAVINSGTTTYFQFDETAGGTAVDAVGGNNATYNSTGITVGQAGASPALGTAVKFTPNAIATNSSGFVSVPYSIGGPLDFGTGAYSIEMWYNTNTTSRGDLLTIKDATTLSDYGIQSNVVAGKLSVYHSLSGGSIIDAPVSGPNLWHFLAVTRAASGGLTKLYVDGQLVGSGSDPASLTVDAGALNAGSKSVLIGANHFDPNDPTQLNSISEPFSGLIDEPAFFKGTTLSAAQVAAQYALGVPEPASLVLTAFGAIGLLSRRPSRRQLPGVAQTS